MFGRFLLWASELLAVCAAFVWLASVVCACKCGATLSSKQLHLGARVTPAHGCWVPWSFQVLCSGPVSRCCVVGLPRCFSCCLLLAAWGLFAALVSCPFHLVLVGCTTHRLGSCIGVPLAAMLPPLQLVSWPPGSLSFVAGLLCCVWVVPYPRGTVFVKFSGVFGPALRPHKFQVGGRGWHCACSCCQSWRPSPGEASRARGWGCFSCLGVWCFPGCCWLPCLITLAPVLFQWSWRRHRGYLVCTAMLPLLLSPFFVPACPLGPV